MLFSTTIAENIAYGSLNPASVTTEEIMNAAEMANADVFLRQFPKGLETVVGERGVMLSGAILLFRHCFLHSQCVNNANSIYHHHYRHHHHIIFIEPKLIHSSKHNTRKQEQCNNVKHEEITLKDKK